MTVFGDEEAKEGLCTCRARRGVHDVRVYLCICVTMNTEIEEITRRLEWVGQGVQWNITTTLPEV